MDLSDEEVLAAPSDDEDDDDVDVDGLDEDEEAEREDEEDDDFEGYGASRADYYGADALETEQDALEEEEEARRIQQKNLKAMKAADFGFDETDWLGTGKDEDGEADDEDRAVTEVLPQMQLTEDMGPAERLKLLKQRYPLFEPLSKEFLNLQERHQELARAASSVQKDSETRKTTPVEVIQYHALSGYLGSLAMYFALLTSTAKDGATDTLPLHPHELQNHPIFTSIEKCQRTWQKVKDLEPIDEDEEEEPDSATADNRDIIITPDTITTTSLPKKSKRTTTITDSTTSASAARRAARLARTEASLAALTNNLNAASKRKATTTSAIQPSNNAALSDDDIGDETPLTTQDAAEKARRKKSLRFYTSQIAQKANKRANAGRSAGGDDDLPYRERFRDRTERLNREAEARGRKGRDIGAALGDDDDGDAGGDGTELSNREREERDGSSAAELALLGRAAAKKSAKSSREAAYQLAKDTGGRVVRIDDDAAIGPGGKRAVGYAIEKNKGLMPRRKKDVKNPRVKKRKKFEEKSKKLGSVRAVYKGGEGRGGYGGEMTGIKSNLVRGVKL